MLPGERVTTTNPNPIRRNEEETDGAVDGNIDGEVVLAIRPRKCSVH